MFTAKVEAGSTVVVFGAGMVGLGAVAGARLQGAERIICVDLSEDRLELAQGPGRDGHLDRRRRTPSSACSTRPAGWAPTTRSRPPASCKVMRQAVESARMGWGLCTVAGVAGKGETLDVVPRYLITGRRVCRLVASAASRAATRCRSSCSATWTASIDVDPFISHRITLDEVNKGFELMDDQDGIRSVIEF